MKAYILNDGGAVTPLQQETRFGGQIAWIYEVV